jgi:hypothetical protein
METNIHQIICCFRGCILVQISYTIFEGNEMYFAQIKTCVQDKIKTHEDLEKKNCHQEYIHQLERFSTCIEHVQPA